MEDIKIQDAELSDVWSLETIVPRSFHPVNPFHIQVFPDTPRVREWWSKVFADEINDPTCRVLVALDPPSKDEALSAIGILCLRLMKPEDRSAGMYTKYGWTSDHNLPLFQPAIDVMIKYQVEIYAGTGKQHYLLELFGVDHAYKGVGIGKGLLQKACDIADGEGYEIFVEVNGSAKTFYEQFGFQSKGSIEIDMPNGVTMSDGRTKYPEHLLVRPASQAKQ